MWVPSSHLHLLCNVVATWTLGNCLTSLDLVIAHLYDVDKTNCSSLRVTITRDITGDLGTQILLILGL